MTRKSRAGIWTLAAIAAVTFASAATAQDIKLTFADQNSPTAWGPTNALQPWVKQAEAATNGKVKFEVYPSQTLVKGPDMWKAVRSGVADVGWCFQGYWPEMTPHSDVIALPGLPIPSAQKGSEVLWRLYEKFPAIRKEYSEIHPILFYTGNPYFLLTSKKQVKTLEDLKGMKIRVTGGPPTEQMKALGAIPTPIPMPDVYQALDKGVIDGMGAPWEAVQGFRLYEVAKYYTMVPLATVYFSICANKQKWESLPQDVRASIMKVGGLEGSKFWGKNFFDTAEQSVIEKTKAGKFEMNKYNLPADELARWAKVGGADAQDNWVKKLEGKGVKEAREVLNSTIEMLKN
jgi:TRAP-type C4-dicarboxylate transport system substrate-binding protein